MVLSYSSLITSNIFVAVSNQLSKVGHHALFLLLKSFLANSLYKHTICFWIRHKSVPFQISTFLLDFHLMNNGGYWIQFNGALSLRLPAGAGPLAATAEREGSSFDNIWRKLERITGVGGGVGGKPMIPPGYRIISKRWLVWGWKASEWRKEFVTWYSISYLHCASKIDTTRWKMQNSEDKEINDEARKQVDTNQQQQ